MVDSELELGRILPKPEPKPSQSQTVTKTSRAKKSEPLEDKGFSFEYQKTRYSDVIGMKRPKAILHKLLELPLKKPLEFEQMHIGKSVGIILYGPPGTGKTYLTKATCGELNIKMCYADSGSVISKYVGESAKKVHELFEEAKRNQPSAIFIDEADVLLQDRDKISGEGGSQEVKQAVSQMLTETSLIHDDKMLQIFMLAATNKAESIDMAHKRSGRFDVMLYIPAPGFWDRRRLFMMYLKHFSWVVETKDREGKAHNEYFHNSKEADAYAEAKSEEVATVSIKELGKITGRINYFLLSMATWDFSPADIEKVCKIAKLNAMEKRKVLITTRSVQKALWSKEAGKSSLDDWFLSMSVKYLQKRKSIIRRIISKKYRDKEPEKVIFDRADMELYADLVKDVQRHMRNRWVMKGVRVFGRGFPLLY